MLKILSALRSSPLMASGARLFYNMSSLASDSIVQADPPETSPKTYVTRTQEELVLESHNLRTKKLNAPPGSQHMLHNHEKARNCSVR